MDTVLVEQEDVTEIEKFLSQEECVAFPTETVFGLAVKYGSLNALKKLYDIKGRDSSKAITLMLSSKNDISKYAIVDETTNKLIQTFMPGKITIILKKKDIVDNAFTSGLDTIGIRIPDNEFVLKLIDRCGPLWVTSANKSGQKNLISSTQVYDTFNKQIPLIVAGECESNIASTVVDVSKGKVDILRLGDISEDMIKEVVK